MANDLNAFFAGLDVPTLRMQSMRSDTWFKNIIRQLQRRLKPRLNMMVFADRENISRELIIGKIYFYKYDPKYKDTLPIWDRFPLVIPYEYTNNGFRGINLHYMSHKYRAYLLDQLIRRGGEQYAFEKSRLRITWQILQGIAKINPNMCCKRYLLNHIRSPLREIPYEDWAKIVILPCAEMHQNIKDRRR